MGLFSRFTKSLQRRVENTFDEPAIVLLYHRVENLQDDPQQLAVSTSNFDAHLTYLRSHYNLLDIDTLTSHIRQKKPFPAKSVAITFDDGYADNWINAIPLLEKHKAQALFYITTSKLNTNKLLWWDELELIFSGQQALPDTLEVTIGDKKYSMESVQANRKKVYSDLHPLIKYTHYKERDRIMKELRTWAGTDIHAGNDHRLLSFDELKKMSDSPSCVIGAHTLDHPVLSQLSPQEQKDQITGSKKVLEEITGKQIHHFSYPFGTKKDYNTASMIACKEAGFRMVSSNFPWQVHKHTDIFQVPRYLVRDWDSADFAQQLQRFFSE